MGLDWELIPPARAGHEMEVTELRSRIERDSAPTSCLVELIQLVLFPIAYPYRRLRERSTEEKRSRVVARLAELTISPGEALGAPRVGIDAAATEWFRNVVEDHRKTIANGSPSLTEHYRTLWSKPFDELVRENQGRHVLDLANYGLDVRLFGSATSCQPGAVIGAFDIPDELSSEAFEPHDADAMNDYANRLESAVMAAVREEQADLAALSDESIRSRIREATDRVRALSNEQRRSIEFRKLVQLADADQAFHIIEWLRFWARRGFGFRPDV